MAGNAGCLSASSVACFMGMERSVENPKNRGKSSRKVCPIYLPSLYSNCVLKVLNSGVYTYPICFAIPGDVPPSITCKFGGVSWRLIAQVHRPGAFIPKFVAAKDVIFVSTPRDVDTGEIVVDRVWDTQLQYSITVRGKSFPIGGVIPVHFALMPLSSIKIYEISVTLKGAAFLSYVFKRLRAY
jgi:hypothetical protein